MSHNLNVITRGREGSCNFIDVRDLANAIIAAAESEYNKS